MSRTTRPPSDPRVLRLLDMFEAAQRRIAELEATHENRPRLACRGCGKMMTVTAFNVYERGLKGLLCSECAEKLSQEIRASMKGKSQL